MTPPRILFYVQYLEGIGHVMRAKRIVEQLVRRGCHVALVLGGNPIPGFDVAGATIHQLPPVHVGQESYSVLLAEDGTPVDEAFKAARRDQLFAIYQAERPNIVITEAYPMGRWAMHFELEPLLALADAEAQRPLILASLRDILQMPKTTEKSDKSVELFQRYYDAMIIHGDPNLVRIEESFPPLAGLIGQAHYTGLVAPVDREPVARPATDMFDVLVSGGGGAIGYQVLAAAIAAKPLSAQAGKRWLALAGPRMSDDDYTRLAQQAEANGVHLERYRDDLVGLMRGAQVSVQRAGYNTIADLLVARCPGVLVPDAGGGQMEQPLRAEKLAALNCAVVVPEERLDPTTLAAAIDRAVALPQRSTEFNLDGAAQAAEKICALWRDAQVVQNARELG